MSRTLHLGKSVHDLGFGLFRQHLSYKSEGTDSVVIYADKWFASSKTCPDCGSVIDRDLNAALNLRDYFHQLVGGIDKNTVGTTGIYASGEVTSTLRETLAQVISMNEEAPPSGGG
jgi:transposase